MTFAQAMISLQLMAEEKIGSVLRAERDAVDAQQDAASAALGKAFGPK